MGRMIKERLVIVGCAFVVLLVFAAVSPRPARPAVPARPVDGTAGALNGWTICVDPGHGGQDGGARARDSKMWEREMNLQMALKVRTALEKEGARVVMSRTDETTFSDNKRQDLTARLDLAQEQGAQMLLSIHMNEYRSRQESGPQVFYRANHAESRLLAGALQSAIIEGVDPVKRRSALSGDYYILSRDLPSVLIECGFISNSQEEKLLLSETYQTQLAQAICRGVVTYAALQQGTQHP